MNQIICIGDRVAGKTHLCLEILNPDGHYIKVVEPDYKFMKSLILDDRGITRAGTINGCRFSETYMQYCNDRGR